MTRNGIKVLVSGTSVAGLSTAYWLARYGFEVTVVERARRLRRGGQALDVRGPVLEVARRMGILDAIRRRRTRLLYEAVFLFRAVRERPSRGSARRCSRVSWRRTTPISARGYGRTREEFATTSYAIRTSR